MRCGWLLFPEYSSWGLFLEESLTNEPVLFSLTEGCLIRHSGFLDQALMIVAAVCPQGGGAVCVRSQSEPELPAETHEEAGQQQPERPADICQ